jgi:hypothetical protein
LRALALAAVLVAAPVAAEANHTRSGPGYHSDAVQHARMWLRDRTSSRAFRCLHRLWERESGWSPRARNPVSGAFGIPQFYPAPTSRYRHKPMWQVQRGLRYIRARYGPTCRALAHQTRAGWY